MIGSKKLWLVTPLALASVVNAGNVVADWNTIGSTTVITNAGKVPAASAVWLAYSSLAMYDAVNAITGEYEPFYYRIAGPSNAAIDAAAVAAAHRILVNYFPLQKTALDTQFTASLAAVTGDPDAKTAGVAVGEAAAMAVISARTGDGLEANVIYTPGSGPGAWIPTPPAFAAPATPWLGQMRPFTMKSASDRSGQETTRIGAGEPPAARHRARYPPFGGLGEPCGSNTGGTRRSCGSGPFCGAAGWNRNSRRNCSFT